MRALAWSRVLLVAAAALALACGAKPAEKKPAEAPAEVKPAPVPVASAPAPSTAPSPAGDVCLPGDPLCDPRFTMPGKVVDSASGGFKDVIQIKAPRKDAAGTPEGTGSVIIFPHKAHATERLKAAAEKCAELKDINDCSTCHHMDKEKEEKRRCSQCHLPDRDPSTKAPSAQEAFHTRCVGCHLTIKEKCADAKPKFSVATSCDQCHQAPPSGSGVSPALK